MANHEYHRSSEQREIYLAEVTRRLQNRLSPLELYESVEELREHLDAMAAAYEEVGLPPEAAMELALRRFGPSGEIGSAIAGSASRSRVAVPIAVPLTWMTTSVCALLLLKLTDLWFATTFHGQGTPLDVALMIAVGVATLVTPAGWSMRRWHPTVCGSLAAFTLNVVLGVTLYQTYASLGRPDELTLTAIALSLSVFLLGTIAAACARRFGDRFDPPQQPMARSL